MNATHNRKKFVTAALSAAAATVAAPALLFLGAGTAQAQTAVRPSPLSVGVTVESVGPSPSWGFCTLKAVPIDPPLYQPDYKGDSIMRTFSAQWSFPQNGPKNQHVSFPPEYKGAVVDVTVHCGHGVDSATTRIHLADPSQGVALAP